MWGPAKANGLGLKKPGMPPATVSQFATGPPNNGSGAIVIDLGPWMTPAYTSNAGIPGLVDALNSLFCAGQLTPAAKTQIVNYASTLSGSNQARDRVRAVVHLIVNSPDFTIQR